MNRVRSSWRKLAALCAVLALTLIQSVSMSRVTTSAAPLTSASADLKLDNELRTLDSFFDDWLKVYQRQRVLTKKASITRAEFNEFKSGSEGIKNRCSQFEGSLREIIRKLKAAGRWDGLDDEVLAKNTDQELNSELREGGGLKHLLEEAASQYCSKAEGEFTGPVESLRPKISAQVHDLFLDQAAPDSGVRLVRASYEPGPPLFTKGLRCIGATIRVAIHLIATGTSGGAGGQHGNKQCFCYDVCTAPTT